MGTRRSAASLSASEIQRFADAVVALKTPDPATGVSHYDRLVAIHGAVMRIEVRFSDGSVQATNMAHWNIGFLPWHRQYLLAFEQALQASDPGVDLPYWDWADHTSATSALFTDAFAGSFGPAGAPAPVTDGKFAGFAVAAPLQEVWGTPLARGGGPSIGWPAPQSVIDQLEDLRVPVAGRHPLWAFWWYLENGAAGVPTHNSGHNLIGGHMAGDFSPNDPLFWMHHANVDRIWDSWQRNYRSATGGLSPADWPPPGETSPIDNRSAPYGHRTDDLMWPWVGAFSGAFTPTSVSQTQAQLLPPLAGFSEVRVRDVLDVPQLGYEYG